MEINSLNIETSQLDSAKREPRPLLSCIIKMVSIPLQCFKLTGEPLLLLAASHAVRLTQRREEVRLRGYKLWHERGGPWKC